LKRERKEKKVESEKKTKNETHALSLFLLLQNKTTLFQQAVAALVGGPLVSLVAMKLFGFSDGEAGASGDPRQDGPKAEALSAALAVSTAVPWAVCALLYNGVHCTYARDKARVVAQQAAERRPRRASSVGGSGVVSVVVARGGGGTTPSSSPSSSSSPIAALPRNGASSQRSPAPPQRSGSIDGRPGDCATGGDAIGRAGGASSSQQRGGGKKRGSGGGA